MYLITIEDDNLNKRHYISSSLNKAKTYLLKEYFLDDKSLMDKSFVSYNEDTDFWSWVHEEIFYTFTIENIEMLEKVY